MTNHMSLVFYINGKRKSVPSFRADQTLASFLRNSLQLTGCKLGCNLGVCGSCTVMLSRKLPSSSVIVHEAVNACLFPLASCHMCAITTVEALGSARSRLHPIQKALAEGHGLQCGFCSPGFVMSAYALLRTHGGTVTPAQLEHGLKGNLCRCTGYRPILQSLRGVCCGGGDCGQGLSLEDVDETQEVLFPPDLLMAEVEGFRLEGDGVDWHQPVDWAGVENVLKETPDALVVGGNGMRMLGSQGLDKTVVLRLRHIDEFQFKEEGKSLTLGAGLTLKTLESHLEDSVKGLEDSTPHRLFAGELLRLLASHGSPQVKNVATVGGSLASVLHYPFLSVLLATLGATVSAFDRRSKAMTSRVLDEISTDQFRYFVIRHVTVPVDNLSAVRFFRLTDRPLKFSACIAKNVNSTISMSIVVHRDTNEEYEMRTLRDSSDDPTTVLERLLKDGRMSATSTGRYGLQLYKEWVQEFVSSQQSQSQSVSHFEEGEQTFDSNLTSDGVIGKPITTTLAFEATAGEAEYVDDIPSMVGELHLALVPSPHAHAKILSIDASKALKTKGVVDFLSAKDVPKNSYFIMIPPADEEVFASEEVIYSGQPVGAIVAESREVALKAVELVDVEYQVLPAVLGIEEAEEKGDFMKSVVCNSHELCVNRGDIEQEFKKDNGSVVKGEIKIEGQEHFYMETHSCLVYPSKEDTYTVYATTQELHSIQFNISDVLQVPMHKVEIRCKRIGGSFGGKSVKNSLIALPSAVAAAKLRCPVRCVLPRDLDIRITGGRHPGLGRYEIKVDLNRRRIAALKFDLSLDGGATKDVSTLVRDYALAKCHNGYYIPIYSSSCRVCRTNRASNTAFRGFGAPKSMMVVEMALEHASEKLGICPDEFREINLLDKGDQDTYGNLMEDDNLRRCWKTCTEKANYDERKKEISSFNQRHKDRKKGMALVPIKFGIGFIESFLNQGSAQINIYYNDGTLIIYHSGVEIGQGIDIKMLQIAAQTLGLPLRLFRVNPLSTNVIPNAIPTAGSTTTDIVGPAVIDACNTLKSRLQWRPVNGESEEERVGRWRETVSNAFMSKIDLSARGYFGHPCPGLDPEKGGKQFYSTYGVACSEVELNCVTGEYRLLRADIVMDVGKSLNPAVDIGQIEGGFLQGVGLFCRERLKFDDMEEGLPKRVVYNYAVPTIRDIPQSFNVHLLTKSSNDVEHAVYSSKGIGEPPLYLGSSVYFAMRRALRAIREDRSSFIRIDTPATSDRVKAAIDILMADGK